MSAYNNAPTAATRKTRLMKSHLPCERKKRSVDTCGTISSGALNGNLTAMTSAADTTHNNADASNAALKANATAAYPHPPASQPTASMMCSLYINNATAAIGPKAKAKRANHAAAWFAAVRRGDSHVSMTNVLDRTIWANPNTAPWAKRTASSIKSPVPLPKYADDRNMEPESVATFPVR